MKQEFVRPGTVREAAYLHLRQAILAGTYPPGTRLGEAALAEALGVSRTPVREAMQRLAQEGLVEIIPAKGARVRVLSPAEVEEVYEVRALFEGEAARLAALRRPPHLLEEMEAALRELETLPPEAHHEQFAADGRFHALLLAASGNRTLEALFHSLDAVIGLIKQYTRDLSASPDAQAQHWAVLEAVRGGRAEEAAAAARAHVRHFKERVLKRLAHTLEERAWD